MEVSADFAASPTYSVNVYNGTELVYSQVGIPSGDVGGRYVGAGRGGRYCAIFWYCDLGILIYTPPSGVEEYEATRVEYLMDTLPPNPEPSCTMVIGGENLPDFAISNIYWQFDPPFKRGDANGDGAINIADAIAMLGYLFGGEPLNCVAAMDVNGDNVADISDPIYELAFLFSGGAGPVGGPACTPDSTPPNPPLECESSGCP